MQFYGNHAIFVPFLFNDLCLLTQTFPIVTPHWTNLEHSMLIGRSKKVAGTPLPVHKQLPEA